MDYIWFSGTQPWIWQPLTPGVQVTILELVRVNQVIITLVCCEGDFWDDILAAATGGESSGAQIEDASIAVSSDQGSTDAAPTEDALTAAQGMVPFSKAILPDLSECSTQFCTLAQLKPM